MNLFAGEWDAVIVGAGVAGGCIAALLADRGWSVLLVEKSTWPRANVCGGCVSASALQMLHEMGMDSAVCNTMPTDSVAWHCGTQTFEHVIPRGAAVLRCDLDAAIVNIAVNRGVQFISGCCASLQSTSQNDSSRVVELHTGNQTKMVLAKIVIACDGISGTFLKDEPWAKWWIAPGALMGVSATYHCDSQDILPGEIHMCIDKPGYVGLVRTDDSTEHMAAALDPAACRVAGGPLKLIREILQSSRRDIRAGLATARLYGEGNLTRHRKAFGGHRVLALGDACGYVEPITGEGMAWAALGALELHRLIPQSATDWPTGLPSQWSARHWQVIGRQQRWCRAIRTTAHHPALASAGIFLGNALPGLGRWVARMICEPSHHGSM